MNDPLQTVEKAGREEAPSESTPQQIGRYRIERMLGKGGFGIVHLAHDGQLQRLVAIKVPHRKLVDRPEAAEAYLTEARTVASLDHPHIVPVFDVGSTEDCPFFIVSKYIEGSTLAEKIKEDRPSVAEAVKLVATVAEALHYAHRKGLVHRDIKPGNILMDTSGNPFVVDFGLALKDENVGHGPKYAGTPAYMSPEQARGEGHRVDGRSDIFSLGVVFYEMLVGRQPFRADSQADLMEQIASFEPRPPRQYDDSIPKELDRICLKALSKRASERYSTAKDMADDLRHFLAEQTVNQQPSSAKGIGSPSITPASPVLAGSPGTSSATPTTPTSDHQPIKIVPKGLRSFDAHDADFFLELLPGPRDRDGLPDSIRFWKTRIEETDADNTFSVGLIYGPSGCGKSSLMKAGLLPRLSDDVIAVYVEATAEETENRLLNGMRKRCPALPDNLSLKETMAALRRGQGIPVGKKVLIVLDQFEQWLHAKKEEENTDLVQALRQCDGGRVQCVVMVRDDFWLAVSRFLRDLEIRLVEGQNSALADLFDTDHARKVLAAFGRAFGKLPENSGDTSKDQKEFLKQAVSGLAQEGKVISVRLALFAEMVKGKPWTPATLNEVGGMEGVGVTFLEETFAASTAPPQHRLHQKAAQAVLKALLPESGTDIKGHMRTYQELLEGSGYASRPKDFDDLIRILDNEIRLVAPTDPEGKEDDSASQVKAGQKYYQLTHDYLVHSLRDWLTRKQKETRRGRAELLLADRAAVWTARPEKRQLPSLWQWLQVCWLTQKKSWTPPQRKMMGKTTKYFAVRLFLLASVVTLSGWGLFEGLMYLNAVNLVAVIKSADTNQVPQFLDFSDMLERWTTPLLRQLYEESAPDSKERLHASLALSSVDPSQLDYLYERLLKAGPQKVVAIRDVLGRHQEKVSERLWSVLENPKNNQDQRFRAACALAAYCPDDLRWQNVSGDIAAKLVTENSLVIGKWVDALRPIRRLLLPPLATFLEDESRSGEQRRTIATVYGTYATAMPDAYSRLEKRLTEQSEPNAPVDARIALAKKQASVGVALLVMGRGEKVWPLLKHHVDPTLRSYLMDRMGPGGIDGKVLTSRLDEEKDVSARRGILLSLGEYGLDRLTVAERQNLVPRLLQLYECDSDPGMHGAAEWLLRQWKALDKLKEIDMGLATGKVEGKRRWYINHQGQTMVMVGKQGEFWLGEGKERHRRQPDRWLAIGSKEVTVDQFLRFRKEYKYPKEWAPTGDCPVNMVTWYEAAAYCNWLSEREGIPREQWCYLPNAAGKYEAGMKRAANYLKRTGYRLPTEAEWKYSCRAGAETRYSFGESEDLLFKYAWYSRNSSGKSHPVGKLRPNDQGLFDMHGNASEWTQDVLVFNWDARVVCGGSFFHPWSNVGSASSQSDVPTNRAFTGFRVARTFTP